MPLLGPGPASLRPAAAPVRHTYGRTDGPESPACPSGR
ncbi:hypothetical protein BX264_6278 [Streptomyces sp. 2333.5]|nr:hypothetical protein BX264_6278 [Streptomyces sp. 2333.5]SEE84726.1 hypothetical protein SAMN05428943_6377 [Streptomyces sp. 2314.4]SEF04160.1 hypothetical protein SAMN05428942_6376 [Streptomyces sp. 2112.2]